MSYEKNTEDCINHALQLMGPMNYNNEFLGSSYVQRIVHALNDHFSDCPILNVTNHIIPCHYLSDDSERITNTEIRLERILLKLQYTIEESNMCEYSRNLRNHFDMSVRKK